MKSFTYKLKDAQGIHARPAGMLVTEASKFPDHEIEISFNGKKVSLKRLMQVMTLGAKCGDDVVIEVTGANEGKVADTLLAYMEANL